MPIEAPSNSIHPQTRAEWRRWLEENQARTEGVWLVSFKKATGKPCVEYEEAVEEALCFGWIDSKVKVLDEERSMLWVSPRKPGSGWSSSNKERVERLIESGQIAPAGLSKIEAAKQDGAWYALDDIEALVIPPDLANALAANQAANQYFDAFPRSVKRSILLWIASAKRPETRTKRIAETIEAAARNMRANQQR